MSALEIRTNNHWRDIVTFDELTEAQQKQLNGYEDQDLSSFFIFKNWVYDLSDFMVVENQPAFKDYDGVHGESFFSGVLIKLSDCGEGVKVAQYFS